MTPFAKEFWSFVGPRYQEILAADEERYRREHQLALARHQLNLALADRAKRTPRDKLTLALTGN